MGAAKRILVVEDHAPTLKILSDVLSHAGYAVLQANDGQQALNVLQDEAVDLVLSDVMMPHIDGITLLGEIRKAPHTQNIPVALVSALFTHEQLQQAMTLGAQGFIRKPFHIGSLLQEVQDILAKSTVVNDTALEFFLEAGFLPERFTQIGVEQPPPLLHQRHGPPRSWSQWQSFTTHQKSFRPFSDLSDSTIATKMTPLATAPGLPPLPPIQVFQHGELAQHRRQANRQNHNNTLKSWFKGAQRWVFRPLRGDKSPRATDANKLVSERVFTNEVESAFRRAFLPERFRRSKSNPGAKRFPAEHSLN